jgi:glycine/D-amino acid oxidase-like deaminating enzyme
MKLTSSKAFWPLKNGLIASYPPLDEDLQCEVAIIGGGFTGAVIANAFVREGVDTVVIEKRDIGFGSTSAATALLQYEIDTHLVDLIRKRGKQDAVRAYQVCLEAIEKIEFLAGSVGAAKAFERTQSLYFASRKRDVRKLEEEYRTRKRHGFDVQLLSQSDIEGLVSFSAPAAILSFQAAQFDPYLLTHQLLGAGIKAGVRAYDRTEVLEIESSEDGVVLRTDRGPAVVAEKVIFATGYETQLYLRKKIVDLQSTYAIVTEPLDRFDGWYERCLIWETARPYLYLRSTPDGRMMVGGEDEEFESPHLRDRIIPSKAKTLLRRVQEMFPALPLEIAFAWAGTFGDTKDALPYIGETKEVPGAYFAGCFGGNGFVFSAAAAEILRDLYLGRKNRDAHIFRFDR